MASAMPDNRRRICEHVENTLERFYGVAPMMRIKAKKVVRDIQAGMNDVLLMEKYHVNPKQLHKVLQKLVEADLITYMQLFERTQLSETQVSKAFVDNANAAGKFN
jgi:transcription initiation factor IIE alpha subunit